MQIRQASLHFLRCRGTIPVRLPRRVRTTLQNVTNINLLSFEPHRLNDLREQLSSATDERFTLDIFVRAWSLADEHELRVNTSDTEHHILPRTHQRRTFLANQRPRPQISNRPSLVLMIG